MMNEFLQYLQYEKNFSSHTVLSYRIDLNQFTNSLQTKSPNFDPTVVQPADIQKWILSLMSAGLSARTLSRKISTIKSFWRFLIKRGYTSHNPTLKIILPKTKKNIPAFFKENEMLAALDNTFTTDNFESLRNQLIITLFYLTGIRSSELINIRDNDIDTAAGTLRVTGKRNKQRIIPIAAPLCKAVEKYTSTRNKEVAPATAYLFVRPNGEKLYPKMVYNMVHNTMSEVSSLYKKSPHMLRHTFATSILNGGADINAVKELLGHSSLAATQVYTHTSFDELHKIYKHAHPRAK
ncbi:MAG TPA: tyrosine-type recombinase/integrase [Paludibacter sp.]|nr:tyrosine-type recombinase/integrase [Paludibacter sp.]